MSKKVDKDLYKQYKQEVRGLYYKFNQNVLRWYLNKIVKYEYLYDSVLDFDSFEEFFRYHTKGREQLININLTKMVEESVKKNIKADRSLALKCFVVRLGNVYFGIKSEDNVMKVLSKLGDQYKVKHTSKEVDRKYKVDATLELQSISNIGIQIKPISYKSYENGEELSYHNEFKNEYGMNVVYIYYLDEDRISVNNKTINLENTEEIRKQLDQILVYNF